METPALSIIVPAYRVEQYLAECIDSILAQTFTGWELILVDDGSPDGSGAICDRYAARDSRIKVIHKPNGGVSAARNDALDIALGRYITFVDSATISALSPPTRRISISSKPTLRLTLFNTR